MINVYMNVKKARVFMSGFRKWYHCRESDLLCDFPEEKSSGKTPHIYSKNVATNVGRNLLKYLMKNFAEVYERVGKSVIWVGERVQRANR